MAGIGMQVDGATTMGDGRQVTSDVGPGYVLRALVTIDLLSHGPLSAEEIAAALGVHRRTAHRLLDVMTQGGWVEPDQDRARSHRLTSRVLTVAGEVMRRSDLIQLGAPVVLRLRDQVGESSHLAVVSDGWAVQVVEEGSLQLLAVNQAVGNRVPLHSSAVGKAIAAFHPEILEPGLAAGLERFTPNTLTTREAVEREFDRIRRDGFAIDDEEMSSDTRCVAAPVRDAFGRVVASLGCSGPAVRVTRDRVVGISRIVVHEADALSRALGYATTPGEPS